MYMKLYMGLYMLHIIVRAIEDQRNINLIILENHSGYVARQSLVCDDSFDNSLKHW